MTVRGKLVSVLLFLGLFMIVPLGFSVVDLASIQEAVDSLSVPVPDGAVDNPADLPPDGRLAERSLQVLTDFVVRARRLGVHSSTAEKTKLLNSLRHFEALWQGFLVETDQEIFGKPELVQALEPEGGGGPEFWKQALEALKRHDARSWKLEPKSLDKMMNDLLASSNPKAQGDLFRSLKKAAVPFRERLLEISRQASGSPDSAAQDEIRTVSAQVQSTTRIFLEELIEIKQREIKRIGFLVAVGGILALFFARVLWMDLLAPLERLRVSINNMAMSGTPTRVDTRGPREVADLLQAYNRLVDMIAAEGQGPGTVACSRCSIQVDKDANYCKACGFPL